MNKLFANLTDLYAYINQDVPYEDETKQFFVILRLYSIMMSIYMIIYGFMSLYFRLTLQAFFCIPWLLMHIIVLFCTYHFRRRPIFHIFSASTLLWIISGIVIVGWDSGIQHFIFPLLLISFLATYDNIRGKIIYTSMIFLFRLAMFFYTRYTEPFIGMSSMQNEIFQLVNNAIIFSQLFIICWFFSQTTQESERKLSQYNDRLKKDAGTDALTGLPNRRAMYQLLDYHTVSGRHGFLSVVMADIDFFKKINDTKGHDCGDAALIQIAACVKTFMEERGYVCRWGGEEFLFLFPDKNGDEAYSIIIDLKSIIERLPIHYKDETFHVTMTFGVEEYTLGTPVTDLLSSVDEKLYIGKEQGRNRIIY